MFKNYFKTALRNLTRNKVYSFINIIGLSLGLSCSMLIILYVKDEVSYDRFHGQVNRIYRITSRSFDKKENKVNWNSNTGYLQGPRFTANIPGIQSFVRRKNIPILYVAELEVLTFRLCLVDTNSIGHDTVYHAAGKIDHV